MTGLVKSQGDIVIFGRQRDIKLAILQAISTQRQVWNKDVGQIVGMPPKIYHELNTWIESLWYFLNL